MGREMEGSILTLSFAKIDIVTKNKGHKTRSFHSFIICEVKRDQTDLGLGSDKQMTAVCKLWDLSRFMSKLPHL